METTKISNYEIEVTKIEPAIESKTKYERSFIENQIKNIQAQKDRDNTLRDAELQECADILSVMDEHGIIVKPIEEIKPVEVKVEPLLTKEPV